MAGNLHSCGLVLSNDSGAAVCWGPNNYGQLGIGDTAQQIPEPTLVVGSNQFSSLSAGLNHSCGIREDHKLLCWGWNRYYQIGDGSNTNRLSPQAVAPELDFKSVSLGLRHTCGILPSGNLHCWGEGIQGELGDGKSTSYSIPTLIGEAWVVIACADRATFGIRMV